jgi:hypothetical protein
MRRQDRLLDTSVSRSTLALTVRDDALIRSAPLVTPLLAPFTPVVTPFVAFFAPRMTSVVALCAPLMAAFHACGLSLGLGCRDHRCGHCRTHGETEAQE